jgi:hypothetical protein
VNKEKTKYPASTHPQKRKKLDASWMHVKPSNCCMELLFFQIVCHHFGLGQ